MPRTGPLREIVQVRREIVQVRFALAERDEPVRLAGWWAVEAALGLGDIRAMLPVL